MHLWGIGICKFLLLISKGNCFANKNYTKVKYLKKKIRNFSRSKKNSPTGIFFTDDVIFTGKPDRSFFGNVILLYITGTNNGRMLF